MKYDFLIEDAFKAMENSYAPYSNYHVGACLLCKDGSKYIGVNVENAAYGSTMCAERNAVFSAYSHGVRKDDIEAIAIVSDGKTLATPCGSCRQVLSELLNPETPVIVSNGKDLLVSCMKELLPYSFTKKDLDK